LLNLGNIPDQVVEDMDFKPGFSTRFKELMDKYKLEFLERTGEEWVY